MPGTFFQKEELRVRNTNPEKIIRITRVTDDILLILFFTFLVLSFKSRKKTNTPIAPSTRARSGPRDLAKNTPIAPEKIETYPRMEIVVLFLPFLYFKRRIPENMANNKYPPKNIGLPERA